MHRRTVLLTGATSGIGRETARGLARTGAALILACRDQGRASALCESLRRESGNPQISAMPLDLASLRSIRGFAEAFLGRYAQLHVLINNAGTFSLRRRETEDGFELTIGTNYLGPFALTAALAPLLAAAEGARIVNVSSDAYRYGRLDLADLQLARRYDGFPAYAASKLAIQLWSQELAERLRPSGVTVNTLHPGHVATGIWQLWPRPAWYQRLALRLMTAWMISPERGARTSLYLATAPEVAGVTGAYFVGRRARPVGGQATDRALQGALWQLSEQLTGATWPEVARERLGRPL